MARRLKVVTKKKPTMSSSPPTAVRPFGVGSNPGHAKVKTTLVLPKALLSQLHERSRQSGVSVNGLICGYIHAGVHGTPGSAPAPIFVQTGRPAVAQSEDRFGPGYYVPNDDDDTAASDYCAWGKIARFHEASQQHPEADWLELGQLLQMTESEARAADQAVETGAFQRYLRASGR